MRKSRILLSYGTRKKRGTFRWLKWITLGAIAVVACKLAQDILEAARFRQNAVRQQTYCEQYWKKAFGSVTITSDMSAHTTYMEENFNPECLRQFEFICRHPEYPYPILFMGRAGEPKFQNRFIVVRAFVDHFRPQEFDISIYTRVYSVATFATLPKELASYVTRTTIMTVGGSSPSFLAGHSDPIDTAHFVIPGKLNGADFTIDGFLLPDDVVQFRFPIFLGGSG